MDSIAGFQLEIEEWFKKQMENYNNVALNSIIYRQIQ